MILHVSTKIKRIPLKSIKHRTLNNLSNIHVMTFNVHLEQLDVAPTRTRVGISLICYYLINCKICDVTLGKGGLRNVTTCDKDGRGVKKSWNSCDVIYGWPLKVNGNTQLCLKLCKYTFWDLIGVQDSKHVARRSYAIYMEGVMRMWTLLPVALKARDVIRQSVEHGSRLGELSSPAAATPGGWVSSNIKLLIRQSVVNQF